MSACTGAEPLLPLRRLPDRQGARPGGGGGTSAGACWPTRRDEVLRDELPFPGNVIKPRFERLRIDVRLQDFHHRPSPVQGLLW